MNNYDLTVGDGVFGDDQNPSGMFNYVQRNEPTVGMAVGGDVESQLRRVLDPEGLEQAPEFAPQQAVDAAFDLALNKQAPQPADVIQNLQQAGAQEAPATSQELFGAKPPPVQPTPALDDTFLREYFGSYQKVDEDPLGGFTATPVDELKRQVPLGFNWQSYLEKNPDLAKAGVDTEAEALRHYIKYGAGEKRTADWTPVNTIQDAFKLALENPNQKIFGEYGITPVTFLDLNPGLDFSAEDIERLNANKPQYYTISHPSMSGKTPDGINYTQTLDVGLNGEIQGRSVNLRTGEDSGTILAYGPNGELINSIGYDRSESWRQPVSMAVALFGSALGAPYIGQTLFGLSGAAGAMAGGATIGGLSGAAAGLEGTDLLKAAAVSGLGAGAGQVANVAGKAAGDFASGLFTDSPNAASLARDIVSGAVKGGITSLPGAIATGDASGILTGGLMGGAGGAFSNLTEGLTSYGIKPSQIQAGINIARGLQSGNTSAVLNSLGGLLDSRNVDIAGKAAVAFNAVRSGNPVKAAAAIMQLGNTLQGKVIPGIKPAGGPKQTITGGEIDASGLEVDLQKYQDLIKNLPTVGEVSEVPEADQSVLVSESRMPIGDQFLDSLISKSGSFTPQENQTVSIIDKYLSSTGTPKYMYEQGKPDVSSQRVELTGQKLGSELKGIEIPEPITLSEVPKAEEIKAPPTAPITIPKAPSSPSQTAPQQALAGRQEERTSLGALPLFESVFYEQRMRQQQLADLLEREENQDPYEVLMRMAERNPEVAVDELMRIIEGNSNVG